MAKTGIKIKPCNVGSVEAHNKRTKEYLEGLEKAGKPLYFFPDLTPNNVSWENPRYAGKTCAVLFEEMKQQYFDTFKQQPQLKDREVINKKTGKKRKIAGWAPIREGCPPIKEDTRIEDFNPIIDWARENGLDIIRIDLHFDEGHIDPVTKERILNRHAQIVFDWFDHETSKTVKLDDKKMSELQTLLAKALDMERGIPKAETGLEHIPAIEYREMKAAENVRKLEQEEKEAQQRLEDLSERCDTAIYVAESEERRAKQLLQANNHTELAQDDIANAVDTAVRKIVKDAIGLIEDKPVSIPFFGSRKDQKKREELKGEIIAGINAIPEAVRPIVEGMKIVPEDIRQEYRRMDEHARSNMRIAVVEGVEIEARNKTNIDLRNKYKRETELLDAMNMQGLPEDVKGRLLDGESVKMRQKWYDPDKHQYTEEAEATLNVSNWKLMFNGRHLKEFLSQVWMDMKRAAIELRDAAQRKLGHGQEPQEAPRSKGRGR